MTKLRCTSLLNIRTEGVADRSDTNNVIGTAKPGFEFISKNTSKVGNNLWHQDGNGHWLWAGGLEEIPETTPHTTEPSNENLNWWITDYGIDKLWKETKGKDIKIAVIDTGLYYDHPNLKNKKNITYYNVVKDSNKKEDCYNPEYSHGTGCAGMIAAHGPNVFGVAPDADLLIISILRPSGFDYRKDLVNAVKKAVELKVDIISFSYSEPIDDPNSDLFKKFSEAAQIAQEENILMVCASGNLKSSQERYPASFESCLSVGGIDKNKLLCAFTLNSNTDILAPADHLDILTNDGKTKKSKGTSYAAPFVAGICALYLSKNKNLSKQELVSKLKLNASDKERIHEEAMSNYHISVNDLGIININHLTEKL